MASAMPVLPDVASISVSPGLMMPRFSASTIIEYAGRSLTLPAGLLPSSLPRMTVLSGTPCRAGKRCRRTSGVLPMVESMVGYMLVQVGTMTGNANYRRIEDLRCTKEKPRQSGVFAGPRKELTASSGCLLFWLQLLVRQLLERLLCLALLLPWQRQPFSWLQRLF